LSFNLLYNMCPIIQDKSYSAVCTTSKGIMCQTIPQKKDIFHLLYVTELVLLADAVMVQRRETTISTD